MLVNAGHRLTLLPRRGIEPRDGVHGADEGNHVVRRRDAETGIAAVSPDLVRPAGNADTCFVGIGEGSGALRPATLGLPPSWPPSSRGPGHRPLTAATGVRIPLGVLSSDAAACGPYWSANRALDQIADRKDRGPMRSEIRASCWRRSIDSAGRKSPTLGSLAQPSAKIWRPCTLVAQ